MKRLLDIAGAGVGLVLLSPLYAAISIGVLVDVGRPVLFRQPRPGLHGRVFELVKFRTMRDAVDKGGETLDDAQRLTAFGSFLRRASLDELPELWNVLRGDMSLVGPRPLLVEYLPLYSPRQARRHECRPGITGWAQIHGRNAQSWEQRFELDLWYVENRSLFLDLRILLRTLAAVWRAEGVSEPGHATREKFRGAS